MDYPKSLSVVIPVYNEEQRIKKAIEACKEYNRRFPQWEFIFVNDGSTDNTAYLVRKTKYELISYSNNQGKGYAIKRGMKKATKPLVLISDIDFSVSLEQVGRLYSAIKQGADIVAGSRKVIGAKITKHQPRLREWLGVCFTSLSNLWLGLNVSDFTCGFKLFKKDAADKLFGLQRIKRWGYDAEILFLAHKFNYKIKEVGVSWKNNEQTKVSILKDVLRSVGELWIIRWNDWCGRYTG